MSPRLNRLKHARSVGFTLLELLVVMVIIGLLVSYVAPRYFGQLSKSEVGVAKAQLDSLTKAISQYRLDTGHFPPNEAGLRALVKAPANERRWNGPYLQRELPLDPWGNPYQYRAPGRNGDFDLYSLGKDGKPGGTGDDADVSL